MRTRIDPVTIWETSYARRTINTVEGAARCLTENWPGDLSSKSYFSACRACLAVLEGKSPATRARNALIKAARDADILAEPT